MRFLVLVLLTLRAVVLARAADAPLPDKVEFNRDIRPIMSDTCFHCHGFDAKSREAGMRLDIRAEALKKTKSDVLPIVPGKPDDSEIIGRIFDQDDPMPPVKAHKPLTDRQKALMKRWVEQGAVYEPHWAYAPLRRPVIPAASAKENPIDYFIGAKLAERNLTFSPEAPANRLLRRMSLDLTGLPPTPQDVAVFTRDRSRDAYAKAVDRSLGSLHFGERMAVWWLDVARFADTVGFHGDQNQRIFPYRDYVIDAFNTNKRFDQFTLEQLAGDLLPNPTPEQLVATGYNRLNMMTREGGAQPREYLAKYGAERVRSVAAAWFGSTFGCAECHDHKFDPIKTRDFYELQSFFADVKQWGVYANYGYTPEPELIGVNNDSPFPPEVEVASPYLQKKFRRAQGELTEQLRTEREKQARDPAAQNAMEAWVGEAGRFLAAHPDGWVSPAPTGRIIKAGKPVGKRVPVAGEDGSIAVDQTLGTGVTLEVTLEPQDLSRLAAVRVKLLPKKADEPAEESDDETDKSAEKTGGKATGKPRMARVNTLTFSLSVAGADGKRRRIVTGTGDATAKRPAYRGGAEISGVVDEWRLPLSASTDSIYAVWLPNAPVALAPGEKIILSFGGDNTAPLRISLSPLGAVEPLEVASPATLAALSSAPGRRKPAQQQAVLEAWQLSTAADRPAYDTTRQLAAAVRDLHGGRAWSLVTQSAAVPLQVRILPRGNWQDETGAVVLPSTPSFLPARIESTPDKRLTRLDLARWIVSKDNPITARAVMNRLWQQFFGIGLSAAVDDLGSQGELPSHPELLEWLACEFRESGWDVKHMIRLIVTSRTYRQNSSLRPELHETDPLNRLLASQNPRRLDAEFVRDNALFIAGILNLDEIGGPSIKPYQPDGYYDALQFPDRKYVASPGAEQWRRGVYVHWQRTFLHPMLANFDAPSRDECAAIRTVSNTPQQALTLLNDPTFVEAARLFAGRLLTDKTATKDEDRIRRACLLAMARDPMPKETTSLKVFLATQREYYHAHPADAEKVTKVGFAPPVKSSAPVDEQAAWTQFCRVLLNAQETITRY